MNLKNLLAAGFVSAGLSGCAMPPAAPQINWADPQVVAAHTNVSKDEFKKITEYKGPDAADSKYDRLFIRAWKTDGSNDVVYQIYVVDFGGSWRFYNSAYDSNGTKLDFLSIDRSVGSCRGGCDLYETVGITVTRQYLEKNQETGVRFKISGKAGDAVKYLPPAFIKGFLAKVPA